MIYGSSVFSIVFAIGDKREMGLYDVPRLGSLLGLGMGIILANFHICGIVLCCNEWL